MGRAGDFVAPYRVDDGEGFHLADIDPKDTGGIKSKQRAQTLLEDGIARLAGLQEKLYAQNQWALLLIFQAMDAAGKDGAIKHVMSGVNPQGCQVFSFKAPSPEELDHDFLWRTMCRLPERGRIGIFNRSYYEEVLVVRVHPELLARQHLPPKLITKDIWTERFEDINAVERYLTRNGVVIRKFFLHVSKKEQKKRFLRRIEDPSRNWKFSASDAQEREHWDEYMEAFEDVIRHTAMPHAPWYVLPANKKWFTRLAIGAAIVDTLESLDLDFPRIDAEQRKQLGAARAILEGESLDAPAADEADADGDAKG
ncbi:MAG: polyphosphate kinase 2 family protein [Candidatus Rokubacteria bacterium]|nr:polyphosphate kinase 2 family protein [Candidatus Rokubacteria bacterium]